MTSKPVMLYDGDCGFCRRWIKNWSKTTEDLVQYEPYQKVLSQFPQLTQEICEKSVQIVMPDGSFLGGAHAIFKALAIGGKTNGLWAYENLPSFKWTADFSYWLVSRHRHFFAKFF